MKFQYYDLGHRPALSTIRVDLSGTEANVMLMDAANVSLYRAGRSFRYFGGHATRSPVMLTTPTSAHWYVVVDLGGHAGAVRTTIEVVS